MIKSWFPIKDESGNFTMETGWPGILKQIYTVFMTPKGTRQWQPEFGSNIHEFIFEHTSSKQELMNEIFSCFKWLPHITLEEYDVEMFPMSGKFGYAAKIYLKISYNNQTLPFSMYIPNQLDGTEGTIYSVGVIETEARAGEKILN